LGNQIKNGNGWGRHVTQIGNLRNAYKEHLRDYLGVPDTDGKIILKYKLQE
jgi:hypothetical protein